MESKADNHAGRKRILIVLLGAIGDVCRGLPLAVRLKRELPDVEIHWAVEPSSRELVEGHPAIDKVLLFDRPGGFSAFIRFLKEVRCEKYDIVLDLQRHLKSGVVSFASRAPRRIGFHRKSTREGNWLFNNEYIPQVSHLSTKIEHFQLFGDNLGLKTTPDLDFGLAPRAAEIQRVKNLIEVGERSAGFSSGDKTRRAALIVGASWDSRLWPAENFRSLVIGLRDRLKMTPILVGGRRDRGLSQEILRDDKSGAIDLTGELSLQELIALFSLVRLAVGPDTGPSHIAAAVGIPIVTIFGATSPLRSAPYKNEQLVLQSPIGCSPCYLRVCPGLGTLCMSDVPSEAVIAQIQSQIL